MKSHTDRLVQCFDEMKERERLRGNLQVKTEFFREYYGKHIATNIQFVHLYLKTIMSNFPQGITPFAIGIPTELWMTLLALETVERLYSWVLSAVNQNLKNLLALSTLLR